MSEPKKQIARFDPMAPIGQPEGGPDEQFAAPPSDEAGAADDRLTRLLDQATRPPADLKLDWGRLRSNLAHEPMLRPAAKPAIKAGAHQRAWWIMMSTVAAAAAVLLTFTLLLINSPRGSNNTASTAVKPGPTPIVPPAVTPTPPQVAAADQPMIEVGLSPKAARQLIAQQPKDMVVVFTRRADGLASVEPASGGGANDPLTLTDKVPLGGTVYGHTLMDADTGEPVYMSN